MSITGKQLAEFAVKCFLDGVRYWYLRFRSWGLRTPAGGQALIARGQNFQGGGYPMT